MRHKHVIPVFLGTLFTLSACDSSTDRSLVESPTLSEDAASDLPDDQTGPNLPELNASAALAEAGLALDASAASTDAMTDGGTDAVFYIPGNLAMDELPSQGSVAFVLVGDSYSVYKRENAYDTSISYISPDAKMAYGWYREKSDEESSSVDPLCQRR